MGSSASTPNGANRAQPVPKLTEGKQIDAYDGKLWWPATIVEIREAKKKHSMFLCAVKMVTSVKFCGEHPSITKQRSNI